MMPPATARPWVVTYNDHTETIPARDYSEAAAIARARACRGRPEYRTRAEALAAGPGPALPCGHDHYHATDLDEDVAKHTSPHPAPADLARLQAHFARLDLDRTHAA